jgi:hypothetical protein
MNKYYVEYWIKNRPKDSETFKTFDRALRFRNELKLNTIDKKPFNRGFFVYLEQSH